MARKKKSEANGGGEAGPGHNSTPELTAEEKQALHFRHVAEYEAALKVKKDGDAALKNCGKRIKAEGGKLAQIKISIALKTPDGEEAFRAEMEERAEVARWNGVGVQMGLFDDDDLAPLVDRATAEGKRAGMAGDPRQSPYQGEAEQAWMAAYHEGQKILVSMNMKRTAPADEYLGEVAAA